MESRKLGGNVSSSVSDPASATDSCTGESASSLPVRLLALRVQPLLN